MNSTEVFDWISNTISR